MNKSELITLQRLREVLHYNPETGVFLWRISTSNRVRAGMKAGSLMLTGYLLVSIDHRKYLVHRLAWLWMTEEWPNEIDHINRNKTDNRWGNLRLATRTQNNANCLGHGGKSGIKGVYQTKEGNWRACIKANGKNFHLGRFATPEAAHAAYLKAAEKHFGQFANGGYRQVWLFGRCSLRIQARAGG